MIRCHQFIWSVLWESVRLRLTLTKDSDNERGNLGCAWFIRNNTYKATRSGNFCQELVHTGQGFKVTQINQWLAMMITSRVHWHKPSNYRYDNVTFFNIRDNGSKTFAYALWLYLVRTQSDRYITNEGLKILFSLFCVSMITKAASTDALAIVCVPSSWGSYCQCSIID